LFANNEIHKLFLRYSEYKEYLAKMNNLRKHHGAGPNAAASA